MQETSLYVGPTFLILTIGCFLHILSDDCSNIMCRVIFSEYYFKDHIGNKCTLVCFNVSSLVRLHACSLLVCHVFL